MSPEKTRETQLEYIPLCEASKRSGYTPEYLNSLARLGKLQAKKIGRNWYTTLPWLEDFMAVTKTARREKIEKLDSEICEYTNGKSQVPAETKAVPVPKSATFEIADPVPKGAAHRIYTIPEIRKESEAVSTEASEVKFQTRWERLNLLATTLVVVFLIIGIFQIVRFVEFGDFRFGRLLGGSFENYSDGDQHPNWIAEDEGIVKGEETNIANIEQLKRVSLASENFMIREIKFGGAIAMASAIENNNLEIYDVHSEVMTTKGNEDNKLLVRWKTNKLALSSIEYSTINGNNPKKLVEDGYGFGHSVVLSNLDPGTAYNYVITTKDKWANEVISDRYSAYTGKKTVSVFDLIVNAIKEVFGWAVK